MSAPYSRLPISLCMIAKNEAEYIGACLDSVSDIVNEMIVVDTGSTDNTIEIARSRGAHVYEVEWRDDFAWARNHSLKHATNPWILQLDADEELLPSSYSWLYNNYPWLDYEGYNVTIHNYSNVEYEEVFMSHELLRFFKYRDNRRYIYRIHENIMMDHRQVASADIQLIHKGYANEVRRQPKRDRNEALLLAELEEKPNEPHILAYLAQQYATGDKMPQAYDYAWKAVNQNVVSPLHEICLRIIMWNAVFNQKEEALEEINNRYNISDFPELLYFNSEKIYRSEQPDYEKVLYYLNTFTQYIDRLDRTERVRLVHNDILRNVHRTKAEIYADQKNWKKAIPEMEKAAKLSPTHFKTKLQLSSYYLEAGELQKARQLIVRSKELLQSNMEKQQMEYFLPQFDNMLERIDQLLSNIQAD